MSRICIIAAVAKNRVIGKDNQLLWHIPEDMKHFRELTRGKPVIMGRKTWESLPERFRPLPGRQNIVVTRNKAYVAEGALLAGSLDEALRITGGSTEIFVIGGAEIYRQALLLADTLYLTEIDLSPEGDASFPDISPAEWTETARDKCQTSSDLAVEFVAYQRHH